MQTQNPSICLEIKKNNNKFDFLLNNKLWGATDLWLKNRTFGFVAIGKVLGQCFRTGCPLFMGVMHWLPKLCKSSDCLVDNGQRKVLAASRPSAAASAAASPLSSSVVSLSLNTPCLSQHLAHFLMLPAQEDKSLQLCSAPEVPEVQVG